MPDYDSIIVGGGHNGLVCAAYLARAGQKVLVLERREIVGGACVTEELFPGFRFSTCSYICYLLQDRVIDELELRRHGLRIHPIEPWRFLPLKDGRRILLWDDEARTAEELAHFSKTDARRLNDWNSFWQRAASLVHPFFLQPAPSHETLHNHAIQCGEEVLFDQLQQASMWEVVHEFFESEPVRAAFLHAHDAGDPKAPGSAWAYTYIKCTQFSRPENVGLVAGGMGGITQALAASAREHGAEIRTGASVANFIIENGRASGVKLSNGTELSAKRIISNADPKRTFLKLTPEVALPPGFRNRIEGLKTKAAYFKFHAALKGVPDFSKYFADGRPSFHPHQLAEVKICESPQFFRQAWLDAEAGRIPEELVMEVQMPSAYDPSVAPPGHHVLSVWALYAPAGKSAAYWDTNRQAIGERLIRQLTHYAPNLPDIILDWSLHTPADMESRMGLTDGNIRHLDMVPGQFLGERPLPDWSGARTPIPGLYLCGAGGHPGGEVTGAPGFNAAQQILKDIRG